MTMRRAPPLSEQDKAVIVAMRDIPLRPGQMLLLGPQSVAMLRGDVEYNGMLPDKHTFEKEEWSGGH